MLERLDISLCLKLATMLMDIMDTDRLFQIIRPTILIMITFKPLTHPS